jgi:type IV secretion system protein VirB1
VDASVFLALALACAPQVHADTARALVSVESAFNPWAIGVVGGALVRQPRHRGEALATARALQAAGWNFSVGLAQINQANFARLGLDLEAAFDPCRNLAAMQAVLLECHARAATSRPPAQLALRRALSCYYSGNFATGFHHGYVRRVVQAATAPPFRAATALTPTTITTTTTTEESS